MPVFTSGFVRGRCGFGRCALISLLSISASAAAANTVYSDSFARGTVATPVSLAGTAPTVGGNTWSGAASEFKTDGVQVLTQSATFPNVSAELPFTPVVGGISAYTLTMRPDAVVANGDSAAEMGFTTSATGDALFTTLSAILIRFDSGGTPTYFNTINGANGHSGTTQSRGPTPDTFTITINDTSTAAPTATYSDTLQLLGVSGSTLAITQADVTNIHGVGFGDFTHKDSSTGGSFSNLLVTTTPEPAAMGLLLAAVIGIPRRRN